MIEPFFIANKTYIGFAFYGMRLAAPAHTAHSIAQRFSIAAKGRQINVLL
ncbi:MAG: hypothetical protein KBG54_01345 [Oscillospiraceae bacterium]|nr:hypothetical protein [Oscillospiraceae bacterium]